MKGNDLFIRYDDGDQENTTTARCRDNGNIRAASTGQPQVRRPSPPSHAGPATGDRVLGQWSDGLWYPARVQSSGNGRYHLLFDDGDEATVRSHRISRLNWGVGTPVHCKWQGGATYYSGVIARISGNILTVRYNDGRRETTGVGSCRSNQTGP